MNRSFCQGYCLSFDEAKVHICGRDFSRIGQYGRAINGYGRLLTVIIDSFERLSVLLCRNV